MNINGMDESDILIEKNKFYNANVTIQCFLEFVLKFYMINTILKINDVDGLDI